MCMGTIKPASNLPYSIINVDECDPRMTSKQYRVSHYTHPATAFLRCVTIPVSTWLQWHLIIIMMQEAVMLHNGAVSFIKQFIVCNEGTQRPTDVMRCKHRCCIRISG